MLPLGSYRSLLDLSPPVPTSHVTPLPTPPQAVNAQLAVLRHLLSEHPPSSRLPSPDHLSHWPYERKDELLKALLTIRDPRDLDPLPQDVKERIEALVRLRNARNPDPVVDAGLVPSLPASLYPGVNPSACPPGLDRIAFHRGDITRLSSPSSSPSANLAIVNPANVRMLGCFQPSHLCADNVIHTAAGPQLREDCAAVMRDRAWEDVETAEDVIVTRGGVLEGGYVLHVAGPQLRQKGDQPSERQVEELSKVYTRCLDLAEELGTVSTVAFPCISTGLFHFPGLLAARLALQTTLTWLSSHPSSSTHIQRIVFVLFSQTDTDNYLAALSMLYPSLPPPKPLQPGRSVPDKVKQWWRDAEGVIIHAGAGLSADAVNLELGMGLDYTSQELFAKVYPGLVKRTPLRTLYHTIGYEFEDYLTKWAFILSHGHRVLTWSHPAVPPVYTTLLSYATSRPAGFTVLTSNADQLFLQSSFPPSQLYTPQGSYAHFQCLGACAGPESWFESMPYFARAREWIDPAVMRVPEDKAAELIPKCRACGGEVFLNVRGGDWFDDEPTHGQGQQARYAAQVEALLSAAEAKNGGFVLLLELGAGFNTPSVVRWPSEELVEKYGKDGRIRLVRVNARDAEVPFELEVLGDGREAVGVKMGVRDFLKLVQSE
ncbi:hypothetical protein JCM21900_000334 [Sporobolomyces salmonicolor]